MVVIGVKSQVVSLFITLATAVAELSFTTGVLLFISSREWSKLENGKSLSVRGHQRVVSQTLAACIAAFIIVEIIVGASIEDELRMTPFTEPCVQTGINTGQEFTSIEQPSRSYLAQTSCSKFKDFWLQIFLTNFSVTSTVVSCADEPVYELHIRHRSRRQIGQAKPYCGENEWGVTFCSFTSLETGTFSFTELLDEGEKSMNETKFIDVKLFFEPDSQDIISKRLLRVILHGESAMDLDAILSRVLLGSRLSTCTFFKARNATRVPVVLMCVLVSIWLCSILLFVCVACSSKKMLFDLNKSLDWSKVLLPPMGVNDKGIDDAMISTRSVDDTQVYFLQLLPKMVRRNQRLAGAVVFES